MKIGVLSDIHDNVWALERALARLEGCEALFVLGDLCSPFTMAMIAKGFGGPVHAVWGNNDGDRLRIGQQAEQGQVTLHGEFAELTLAGQRVALTHYPQLGRALAAGQGYDLVCYGHDHERGQEQVGRTLLLNPGEVMGRLGVSSVALYDTETSTAEIVEL